MSRFKKAETLLKDYLSGKMHEDAQRRKEELLYPTRPKVIKGMEQTTKVQSTLQPDQLERKVLSYVEDGTYVFIKGQIRRIEKFLKHTKLVDDHTYQILILFYKYEKTWVHISSKVNISEATCRRRRNKAIEELTRWI